MLGDFLELIYADSLFGDVVIQSTSLGLSLLLDDGGGAHEKGGQPDTNSMEQTAQRDKTTRRRRRGEGEVGTGAGSSRR